MIKIIIILTYLVALGFTGMGIFFFIQENIYLGLMNYGLGLLSVIASELISINSKLTQKTGEEG